MISEPPLLPAHGDRFVLTACSALTAGVDPLCWSQRHWDTLCQHGSLHPRPFHLRRFNIFLLRRLFSPGKAFKKTIRFLTWLDCCCCSQEEPEWDGSEKRETLTLPPSLGMEEFHSWIILGDVESGVKTVFPSIECQVSPQSCLHLQPGTLDSFSTLS